MLSCHIEPFTAFVKDLQMYGCEVHLYRGPNTFWSVMNGPEWTTLTKPPWDTWDNENIYFLAGVRPGLRRRAADQDVLWRNMFTLDFDIRKEMEKGIELQSDAIKKSFALLGTITADDAVKNWAEEILNSLESHPTWSQFRYAVLSGNGLHLHYFGEPCKITEQPDHPQNRVCYKEEWIAGMKDIFAEINAITPIPCDTGCGNAGRIMRMPGSWNVKDPSTKKAVEFLVWQPKNSLPPLSFVQERGALAMANMSQRKSAEQKEFADSHPDGGSDVIALINSIPIEQVVHQLLGCTIGQVKRDGGMRFVDAQGKERGFFKHKEFNVVVHEGTSLFPAPSGTGYNCLGLVKAVNGCGAREAIAWFTEKSAKVRETIEAERTAFIEEHAGHDVELVDKGPYRPTKKSSAARWRTLLPNV